MAALDSLDSLTEVDREHLAPFLYAGPTTARSTALQYVKSDPVSKKEATNDRKGLGTFLSHLVGGFDLMLGHRSQALDRIGANGIMVLRMGVESKVLGCLDLEARRTSRNKCRRIFPH